METHKNFKQHIDYRFKGGTGGFVMVDRYKAHWSSLKKTGSIPFTRYSLKKVIKYLLDNCYFKLDNKTFRQLVGIPMTSDDSKWIKKAEKSDIR